MSTLHSPTACSLACIALLAASAAQAGEITDTAAPNADMRYAAASVQRDVKHNEALLTLLSLPVADRAWIQLGGGQTRQEQPGSARSANVLSAGAGYIGNAWQASLAVTHRDAGSSLRQTDWDGLLEWRGEQFGAGIDGHYRDASASGTMATPTVPPGTANVSVLQRTQGNGIGVHGNVRLTDNFKIYAAAMRYDYRVSTQQNGSGTGGGSSLLSSALSQANPSLVSRDEATLNRSSKLGASYQFEKATLSGELLADRVLDEPGTVLTLQVKAALQLTPQWTVTPNLGRTRSKTYGDVTFAGLALSRAW